MARVTVEDCLEQEDNRFAIVGLASKRTRGPSGLPSSRAYLYR
jgi:hypothetical protein